MMYGYEPNWVWMMVMLLVWFAFLAAIVWAVIRVTQGPRHEEYGRPRRETALEILDRRYASGEIDEDAYLRTRAHVVGTERG